MATLQQVRLDEMRGCPVYDTAGDRIGSVEEIYYDSATSTPEWIGIGTGFFGMKHVFVPVEGASVQDDAIFVPYDKDKVKDSPDIDEDEIYGDAERELYAYYGLRYKGPLGEGRRRTRTGEESVTRAEEEIHVGKEKTAAGSVRLRKWVETEPVTLDVELRRETARVVREPLDQPVGRDADAFEEKEVEIPLSKEEPVVAKKTVAKERVGVETDVQTERRTVQDEVRKERVEIEGDADER